MLNLIENPDLVKLATKGSNPDVWVKEFDQDTYSSLLQRLNMPILPWVESVATGLDARGASNIAEKVRAGGLIVETSFFEDGDDAEEKRFIKIQNLLEYLDRTLPGLNQEESSTGQAFQVLTLVLQGLNADHIEKLASEPTQ